MTLSSTTIVLFLTAFATAAVGSIVAWIAYTGYQRNDSEPMLFLAIGIAFVTVGPFLIGYGVASAAGLSDAESLLGVLCAYVAGLLAIIYSLDGT